MAITNNFFLFRTVKTTLDTISQKATLDNKVETEEKTPSNNNSENSDLTVSENVATASALNEFLNTYENETPAKPVVSESNKPKNTNSARATRSVSANSTSDTPDFKVYSDLTYFIFFTQSTKKTIQEKGLTDWTKGFTYKDVGESVAVAHKSDFSTVTKDQIINELVAEYNRRIENPTDNSNTAKKGDFTEYSSLAEYIYNKQRKNELQEKGITDWNKGFSFNDIAKTVATAHQTDYATVTKEQLTEELIAEYNKRTGNATNDNKTDGTEKTDDTKKTEETGKTVTTEEANKIITITLNTIKTAYKNSDSTWGFSGTQPRDTQVTLLNSKLETLAKDYIATYQNNKNNKQDFETALKTYLKTQISTVLKEIKAEDSNAAKNIKSILNKVKYDDLRSIIGNNSELHTEFGMDSNGNIVFQESSTTSTFNTLVSKLKSRITSLENGSKILEQIGGESALKKLVQSAWITTYTDFPSSQKNNSAAFVSKVLSNLDAMLTQIQKNPDNLALYTQRSSYADKSLTSNLIHYNTKTTYGGDERINYKGDITQDSDGTVHIGNKTDDPDYQITMDALFVKLQEKYPNVDSAKLKKVFQEAQKDALSKLQGNVSDCPYGTGNNSGRVEDYRKDWSGKDNRSKDKYNIDMDQLVQMTLYTFDKLFIKELNNGDISA